jgi:hypothetical protein
MAELGLMLDTQPEGTPCRCVRGELGGGGVHFDAVGAFVAPSPDPVTRIPQDGPKAVVVGIPHIAEGPLEDRAHTPSPWADDAVGRATNMGLPVPVLPHRQKTLRGARPRPSR